MDSIQAKLILRAFRDRRDGPLPDDFEAALEFAARDPALGEWLKRERQRDAAFADDLRQVPLPEGLREEILAASGPNATDSTERDHFDEVLSAALSAVAPPVGLRREILIAMKNSQPEPATGRSWWRFAAVAAAAAGIALAFVITGGEHGSRAEPSLARTDVVRGSAVPVTRVIDAAISHLSRSALTFDLAESDRDKLFAHIRDQGFPSAGDAVPVGLADAPALGCSFLEIDDHRGVMICFRLPDREFIHLIVFAGAHNVTGDGSRKTLRVIRRGEWSAVPWGRHDQSYVLLTKASPDDLLRMF